MTSPVDPIATLGDTIQRYQDTQTIMQQVADELRQSENATRAAAGLPIGLGLNETLPSQ